MNLPEKKQMKTATFHRMDNKTFIELCSEAPNNGFLLNTLKTLLDI